MMTKMFSVGLALFSFVTFGIQAQNFDNFQQGYPFGILRYSINNINGVVASLNNPETTKSSEDQTFSPSCTTVRANIRNAHPFDKTKYYICRNPLNYEIITCPNGGLFDDQIKGCIDLCEQKKPCLNDGQCIILSNLTLQCVCRRDWTGDRCEIPLSSCVNQPCGPNAECRMLKASDYTQDYVCICNKQQNYGRNCQQTVPNPCLANTGQFHPFAFSRRAYINCDDKIIFFQPCYGSLNWNQEEKRCDRLLPELFKFLNLISINPNEKIRQNLLTVQKNNRFVDGSITSEYQSNIVKPQQDQSFLDQQSPQINPNDRISKSADVQMPSTSNQLIIQSGETKTLHNRGSLNEILSERQTNRQGFMPISQITSWGKQS